VLPTHEGLAREIHDGFTAEAGARGGRAHSWCGEGGVLSVMLRVMLIWFEIRWLHTARTTSLVLMLTVCTSDRTMVVPGTD
jgi:hypothetical protein